MLLRKKIQERSGGAMGSQEIQAAFNVFGRPTNGITLEMFKQQLMKFGIVMPPEDAETFFNKYDANKVRHLAGWTLCRHTSHVSLRPGATPSPRRVGTFPSTNLSMVSWSRIILEPQTALHLCRCVTCVSRSRRALGFRGGTRRTGVIALASLGSLRCLSLTTPPCLPHPASCPSHCLSGLSLSTRRVGRQGAGGGRSAEKGPPNRAPRPSEAIAR